MSTEQWSAVTVNLGCGGPHSSEVEAKSIKWMEAASERYAVVFAQEMPHSLSGSARYGNFAVFESRGRQYLPRSAVFVRADINAKRYDFPTDEYHGSFVAAAEVDHPSAGRLVLMSVHASPNPASADWLTRWKKCGVDRSLHDRSCGVWDSDLVLESVRHVNQESGVGGLIAAGDWNEARHWDDGGRHRVKGGREFFRNVNEVGLVDRCCPDGAHETEARDGLTTSHGLHLDHVFTSQSLGDRVVVTGLGSSAPADHRPVEFTIG